MDNPCGCVNAVDPDSGVLRSVSKCDGHRALMRDPATLDAAYYEELGVIDGGRLAPTNHVAELVEALGPIPRPSGNRDALEIGGGASPYVEAIRAAGWTYTGLEPSRWAAEWARQTFGVVVVAEGLEATRLDEVGCRFGLILAAHCFEHMADAPAAIRKAAGLLVPGGELWVVVPDDSDPCNPDHLFFFSPTTLRACLERAGLVVERLEARRIVAHERFLYARASKPAA